MLFLWYLWIKVNRKSYFVTPFQDVLRKLSLNRIRRNMRSLKGCNPHNQICILLFHIMAHSWINFIKNLKILFERQQYEKNQMSNITQCQNGQVSPPNWNRITMFVIDAAKSKATLLIDSAKFIFIILLSFEYDNYFLYCQAFYVLWNNLVLYYLICQAVIIIYQRFENLLMSGT